VTAAAAAEPTPPRGVPFAEAGAQQVMAALTPEDAQRFGAEWREALSRAGESLDLAEVFEVLERWRRVAWLTSAHGHAGYRKLLADADQILATGERPAGTVGWDVLRSRLGL
jgi:hypothetical protein